MERLVERQLGTRRDFRRCRIKGRHRAVVTGRQRQCRDQGTGGMFVFYHQPVAELLDLKIFIDADEHVKLSRRIIRDRLERGYDVEDVLYRYEKHVAPTYVQYIEPFKTNADLVIPNNQHFDQALEVLRTFLKAKATL